MVAVDNDDGRGGWAKKEGSWLFGVAHGEGTGSLGNAFWRHRAAHDVHSRQLSGRVAWLGGGAPRPGPRRHPPCSLRAAGRTGRRRRMLPQPAAVNVHGIQVSRPHSLASSPRTSGCRGWVDPSPPCGACRPMCRMQIAAAATPCPRRFTHHEHRHENAGYTPMQTSACTVFAPFARLPPALGPRRRRGARLEAVFGPRRVSRPSPTPWPDAPIDRASSDG